jgi:hypothetical protein
MRSYIKVACPTNTLLNRRGMGLCDEADNTRRHPAEDEVGLSKR